MENYRKGKNIEEPLEKCNIPIENLPDNLLWMHVRGGSKIRNLLTHALEEFPAVKHVIWTGYGPSVGKCITCAEIMKKECKNSLHQITRLCYRNVEEYWDPLLPELDQLVVKRKLPMIHIYLSEEPLNPDALGYQAPGIFNYEPRRQSGISHRKQDFDKRFDKTLSTNPSSSRKNKSKRKGNSNGSGESSRNHNNSISK